LKVLISEISIIDMQYKRAIILILVLFLIAASIFYIVFFEKEKKIAEKEVIVKGEEIFLPLPSLKGEMSVEEAIARRRSVRSYLDKPLTIVQLSQILWAAQGITDTYRGFRAAPSAGATYPLEIYVVIGEKCVFLGGEYLDAGVYKYNVEQHSLILVKKGDYREDLAKAALNQAWVEKAPVDIVITAVYERTTARYGERGIRYVHIEVGHVGQNIYLQATALGLGTVAVGAFYDPKVKEIIGARLGEEPLYIMPIGVVSRLHELTVEDLASYYEYKRG